MSHHHPSPPYPADASVPLRPTGRTSPTGLRAATRPNCASSPDCRPRAGAARPGVRVGGGSRHPGGAAGSARPRASWPTTVASCPRSTPTGFPIRSRGSPSWRCAVAEVSVGARPAGQLTRWVARDELARLARRGTLRGPPSLDAGPRGGSDHAGGPVRADLPGGTRHHRGALPCSSGPSRAQAIALRIEAVGGPVAGDGRRDAADARCRSPAARRIAVTACGLRDSW